MGLSFNRTLLPLALWAALPGCGSGTMTTGMDGPDGLDAGQAGDLATTPDLWKADMAPDTDTLLSTKVTNIVFIYAENRSFDNIFGTFPGANGIPGVNATAVGSLAPQLDRGDSMFAKLPVTWGGLTAAGQMPVVTQAMTDNLPNKPFLLSGAYAGIDLGIITRDLYHRFFENQMQINGGKSDKFAAWADSGGLTMGYYDGSKMALWAVAQQYVLADNFYQAAFGGSFLNHQYLICACAPEYPNADTAAGKPTIAAVDKDGSGKFLPRLTPDAIKNTASAIDGAPVYTLSGNIAPNNYFGDGKFYAINTMQPAYQPSSNAPAAGDMTHLYADPAKATTLPPQTAMTIGDALDGKSVTWKWYAGAFKQTLATAVGDRAFPAFGPGVVPNYQFHHQPFNYYAKYDPTTGAAARAAHFADYTDLVADAAAGTLPAVTFYKPEGDLNEHGGYASVSAGDAHLAALIAKLQASPQWKGMIIVLTYDENGGWWDHAAPPKGDLLGPGSRIPALIVSPFAKKGTVDHTPYDTASIQRLINRRFGLTALPGLAARDTAIKAGGGAALGDFVGALDLSK